MGAHLGVKSPDELATARQVERSCVRATKRGKEARSVNRESRYAARSGVWCADRVEKVDKTTGAEVAIGDVVKGVQVHPGPLWARASDRARAQRVMGEGVKSGPRAGQFVTLTKEEIWEALPKSTQTIEIEAFVRLQDVPPVFYNKPCFVSPTGRAQKVYALLREVLRRTGRARFGPSGDLEQAALGGGLLDG